MMKKGMTVIEVMILVAIAGIGGALVLGSMSNTMSRVEYRAAKNTAKKTCYDLRNENYEDCVARELDRLTMLWQQGEEANWEENR